MPQIYDMGPMASLPLRRKVCWGSFAQKIRQLRPGWKPRTWVLKASTLPLQHWSRLYNQYTNTDIISTIYTILSPYHVLSDTHSQYTTTNIITTIYTILSPYLVLPDTKSQDTNTNIITTIYTISSPYIVLPDTKSQYTNTNIITTIYTIFSPLHTLVLVVYFQVFI